MWPVAGTRCNTVSAAAVRSSGLGAASRRNPFLLPPICLAVRYFPKPVVNFRLSPVQSSSTNAPYHLRQPRSLSRHLHLMTVTAESTLKALRITDRDSNAQHPQSFAISRLKPYLLAYWGTLPR